MPTRYPTLRPIAEDQPIWLAGGHLRRIREACARICSRTGAEAFIDTRRRKVNFGYSRDGDVSLLDIVAPLYRGPTATVEAGFDPILDAYSEDEVVRLIRLARVPVRIKDQWKRYTETERKSAESRATERRIQDKTPQVEEFLRRRRERRGMGRHFQRSRLVNGTKGAAV